MAMIELTPEGENRIVSFPGANGSLSVSDLIKVTVTLERSRRFGTQLEIPLRTVEKGVITGQSSRKSHSPQPFSSGSTLASFLLFRRFYCAE